MSAGARSRRRLKVLISLLIAAAAAFAWQSYRRHANARDAEFLFELQAAILEPTAPAGPARKGNEMEHGRLRWSSPTSAGLTTRAWFARAEVRIGTDSSRRKIRSIDIRPRLRDSTRDPWDLWRHRHGYIHERGETYSWLTVSRNNEPMPLASAKLYDAHLKAVWEMWVRRRLAESSRGALRLKESPGFKTKLSRSAILRQPFKVRFSPTGLIGKHPVSFTIRIWHIPVRVLLVLRPAGPGRGDGFRVLLDKAPRTEFDRGEWRRRHGYRKTKEDGYVFDDDLPGASRMSDADGKKLDLLMERGVGYWARAAAEQFLAQANFQLITAMGLRKSARSDHDGHSH